MGLFATACLAPTDRSNQIVVEMDAIPAVIENDTLLMSARVTDGSDVVPNAEVEFFSDDPTVLIVNPDGVGLAVAEGTVTVSARALTFAGAEAAEQIVNVSAVYAIDSVGPPLVRFGETVDIVGVGLNKTLVADFGGGEAIFHSYTPADPLEPDRFGTLSLWAAPPAGFLSQAFLIGPDGILISDTIRVLQQDIYEPNDSVAWDFGVLTERVFNPATAFERIRRGEKQIPVDWYQFTTATPGDWTISVSAPTGGNTFDAYVISDLAWGPGSVEGLGFGAFGASPNAWSVGAGFRACGGQGFFFPQFGEYSFTFEAPPDSAIIPLKDLPAGTYHLFVGYGGGGPFYDPITKVSGIAAFVDSVNVVVPLRSGIDIRPGYRSPLPPDPFEENDYCDVATTIPVPTTLSNLTIDSPHDADWFKFRVSNVGETVNFSVTASEVEADLDLYVLKDDRPDSLLVVDFVFEADGNSTDVGFKFLQPGDYFLIVVDFVGVPTAYTLTTGIGAVSLPSPQLIQGAAVDARRSAVTKRRRRKTEGL